MPVRPRSDGALIRDGAGATGFGVILEDDCGGCSTKDVSVVLEDKQCKRLCQQHRLTLARKSLGLGMFVQERCFMVNLWVNSIDIRTLRYENPLVQIEATKGALHWRDIPASDSCGRARLKDSGIGAFSTNSQRRNHAFSTRYSSTTLVQNTGIPYLWKINAESIHVESV